MSDAPAVLPPGSERPGPGEPGWAWRVNRAVVSLARAHRARAASLLRGLDLHPGQEVLLLVLADTGPTTPGRLAGALSIEPPTVTKMVQRLEGAGLVRRDPDPADRRSTVVSLTPAARERLHGVDEAWTVLAEETLAGLDERERVDLVRLLERAAAGLPGATCR
ncbi:MarR family winged helix-turn-helix transcriptional regulator [Aquipuribacter nitratireducens]|uniref:MarR family winged helix-turn-helix transcriptional regulator n=1 Tax=Aquipuribacter nitratireducens TaxID=650104 RepID=A0ABW0GKQ8_9MICO